MTKNPRAAGRRSLMMLALLIFCPVSPASAITVLFASGEDSGFTAIGASAVGVTGVYSSRSGFARDTSTVIAVDNTTAVADPPASRFQTPTFTSVSTVWIHAQVYLGNNGSNTTTANQQALIIRSPDGVARIVMRQTGTNGQLKMSKRNAAATITDLATASANLSATTLTALDIEIIYGCTSGDQVNVWYAGSQVITFTGASICTDAATQLNQVEIASLNGSGSGAVGNGGGTGWSEIIISDSDTRGMALWTLKPTAAGNTQSWTPNTVGNVNPAIINDTNFVTTGSNSSLSEWTTPTTVPTGTWGVLGVVQEGRVLRGTTGPQNFEWLLRTTDGSDHVAGSVGPSTSFGNFGNQIWTTNPHTSASWVTSDIASGFNLGIESLP